MEGTTPRRKGQHRSPSPMLRSTEYWNYFKCSWILLKLFCFWISLTLSTGGLLTNTASLHWRQKRPLRSTVNILVVALVLDSGSEHMGWHIAVHCSTRTTYCIVSTSSARRQARFEVSVCNGVAAPRLLKQLLRSRDGKGPHPICSLWIEEIER